MFVCIGQTFLLTFTITCIHFIFMCSIQGLWKVCEKYRKLMNELAQVSTSNLIREPLKIKQLTVTQMDVVFNILWTE